LPPYAEEERKPLPATQQELTNRLRYQERLGEELAMRFFGNKTIQTVQKRKQRSLFATWLCRFRISTDLVLEKKRGGRQSEKGTIQKRGRGQDKRRRASSDGQAKRS